VEISVAIVGAGLAPSKDMIIGEKRR